MKQLAHQIVQEATGKTPEPVQVPDTRNPAAVALSKLGASKGGQARAAALSPARRSAIARKAVQARWKGKNHDRVSQLTAKPYVQVACVCEKALIEPDGVVSLIRIVDTYFMETPQLPAGVRVGLPLIVVVLLKSGDVIGESEIGLQAQDPDGNALQGRTWPVVFNGGESGMNLRVTFVLDPPKLGLYWFDVRWGDEILTRIPLRIKPKPAESTADAAESTETQTLRN